MIFLTVGTQLPFDRLTRTVDAWCAARGRRAEVFGQIGVLGPDNHRPEHFEFVETLAPEAFDARFAAADAIVAHAGMGSIIGALTAGKPIALLPRRADLGEQRNDHQLATAARFRDRPGVLVAETEAMLATVLDSLGGADGAGAPAIEPYAEDRLIAALRDFIIR